MPDRSHSAGDDAPARPEAQADASAELFKLAHPLELVPAEFRDVSFGSALGGYNRNDVDAYVERVNRLIAELEISRSPEKAVQLALERVGEQTAGILQEARDAAEKLTAAAEAEAEHATRRARVEADELMERAQKESRAMLERAAEESTELLEESHARLEAMRGEIARVQREHGRAVEELRRTAAALSDFAEHAGPHSAAGDDELAQPQPDPSEVPTETTAAIEPPQDDPGEQPTESRPAVEPSEDKDAQRRRITGSRPRVVRRATAESGRARSG